MPLMDIVNESKNNNMLAMLWIVEVLIGITRKMPMSPKKKHEHFFHFLKHSKTYEMFIVSKLQEYLKSMTAKNLSTLLSKLSIPSVILGYRSKHG